MAQGMASIRQKLEMVPDSWQQELFAFLSNEKRFQQLERMLQDSSLMLEGNGYQMPIYSAEELVELKRILEEALLV